MKLTPNARSIAILCAAFALLWPAARAKAKPDISIDDTGRIKKNAPDRQPRKISLSSTSFMYDAAGNMLADGANSYAYNAESEIKSAAGVNYTYDGDGNRNRIQKSSGKIYWYGAGTEILDESDANGNFTKRTLVQAGATTPCYDADFLPFGRERAITNTCSANYKFEGKKRDSETGNDDFGARFYRSNIGRWMSADWSSVPAPVPYANLTNPQTLNLYAMVSDNISLRLLAAVNLPG